MIDPTATSDDTSMAAPAVVAVAPQQLDAATQQRLAVIGESIKRIAAAALTPQAAHESLTWARRLIENIVASAGSVRLLFTCLNLSSFTHDSLVLLSVFCLCNRTWIFGFCCVSMMIALQTHHHDTG